MSSIWGKNVQISIFGESHGKAIGVTINGLQAGFPLDTEEIAKYMARRKASGTLSTPRKEDDLPEIISGVFEGKTTGAPLTAIIYNNNTKSSDYEAIKTLARPGHADYTAFVKYHGANDYRGGGHFSGRLTACIVFAGAVCSQILKSMGIDVSAHIASIGKVNDVPFSLYASDELKVKLSDGFPVINDDVAAPMQEEIANAAADKDSVGGVIECMVSGIRAGIGSPMFDGVENKIASIIFGIPAVKGIEFGLGFAASKLRGSENNDEFSLYNGAIRTNTNNCGGVLGGITNGMPIVFRAAFKPTPSIARLQHTVDVKTNENAVLEIKGRHDPCVVVRAVPVVTAATAIAVLDLLSET